MPNGDEIREAPLEPQSAARRVAGRRTYSSLRSDVQAWQTRPPCGVRHATSAPRRRGATWSYVCHARPYVRMESDANESPDCSMSSLSPACACIAPARTTNAQALVATASKPIEISLTRLRQAECNTPVLLNKFTRTSKVMNQAAPSTPAIRPQLARLRSTGHQIRAGSSNAVFDGEQYWEYGRLTAAGPMRRPIRPLLNPNYPHPGPARHPDEVDSNIGPVPNARRRSRISFEGHIKTCVHSQCLTLFPYGFVYG